MLFVGCVPIYEIEEELVVVERDNVFLIDPSFEEVSETKDLTFSVGTFAFAMVDSVSAAAVATDDMPVEVELKIVATVDLSHCASFG